jgi:hypothetical protein
MTIADRKWVGGNQVRQEKKKGKHDRRGSEAERERGREKNNDPSQLCYVGMVLSELDHVLIYIVSE